MKNKYVVKDFEAQSYYCGEAYGWSKEAYLANYFDEIEDAKRFIDQQDGKFQIELVYVI